MLGRLLLAGAILLLPGAAAQSVDPVPTVRVASPPELLTPESGVHEHTVSAEIPCPLRRNPAADWVVSFEKTSVPEYANAVLNPPSAAFRFDDARCADLSYRVKKESVLYVTVNRDAPALERFVVGLRVRVHQADASGATAAEATGLVDYVPRTQVNPERVFQKVAPGRAFAFPLELQNHGNGPTIVRLSFQPVDGDADLRLEPIPEVELESRSTSGPDAKSKLALRIEGKAPGAAVYRNSIHSFLLVARSASPDPRATIQDEFHVVFSVQVQGSATPGAPMAWLAAALLATAWSRRRAGAP